MEMFCDVCGKNIKGRRPSFFIQFLWHILGWLQSREKMVACSDECIQEYEYYQNLPDASQEDDKDGKM